MLLVPQTSGYGGEKKNHRIIELPEAFAKHLVYPTLRQQKSAHTDFGTTRMDEYL